MWKGRRGWGWGYLTRARGIVADVRTGMGGHLTRGRGDSSRLGQAVPDTRKGEWQLTTHGRADEGDSS